MSKGNYEGRACLLYNVTQCRSRLSIDLVNALRLNRHPQLSMVEAGVFIRAFSSEPKTSCKGKMAVLATDA